jgi:hypothetical protein
MLRNGLRGRAEEPAALQAFVRADSDVVWDLHETAGYFKHRMNW